MKINRIFALLLPSAFLVFGAAFAQVDPKVHNKCIKAADYKGCVEVISGNQKVVPAEASSIVKLKDAMRLLPGRLENTNLQNFTSNTQVYSDAVSMASDSDAKNDYERELLSEARAIKGMVESLQSYWSARIYNGTYYGTSGYKSYYCSVLKPKLDDFNSWASSRYYVAFNGTESNTFLLGRMETCYPQEAAMTVSITRRVQDALVDPEARKAEIAKKKREEELAKMGPWLRYLEENPKIKKWMEANPAAGEKEKAKFLKKQVPQSKGTEYYNSGSWDSSPFRYKPSGQ